MLDDAITCGLRSAYHNTYEILSCQLFFELELRFGSLGTCKRDKRHKSVLISLQPL